MTKDQYETLRTALLADIANEWLSQGMPGMDCCDVESLPGNLPWLIRELDELEQEAPHD